MQLYFTRHGKTEWNQARRFQGMMGDSPLLPELKVIRRSSFWETQSQMFLLKKSIQVPRYVPVQPHKG